MSKRLTDTEKWKIAWFRKLTPKMKCAWSFMLDNCDHAGVWHEDVETLSHHVGESVDIIEIEEAFKGKVVRFDGDKFFISAFIEFQYGILNPGSKVHQSVIKKLDKHKLYYSGCLREDQKSPHTVCHTVTDRVTDTVKDKDKDKAKNKDKEEDKEKREDKNKAREILANWNECDIVKHGETSQLLDSVLLRIEKIDRPIGEIVEAMNNYAGIYHDSSSFFKYRWTLDEFLQRKSAMAFYPDSFFPENYKNKSNTSNQKQSLSAYAQEMFDNNPYRNGEVL